MGFLKGGWNGMDAWRLLGLRVQDAFMNMAVDEAILTARIEDVVSNTLRLYRWRPSAVSVGYFQDAGKEANLEACRNSGVDVVRRPTGGGAVYHAFEGEITYSIIVNERDLGVSGAVTKYQKLCGGIIYALGCLGVRAEFSSGSPRECPNILVSGRKISGNAQLRRRGVILQHGTVLVDLNLVEMFTFLRVPWAKSVGEVVQIAEKKHISLRQVLNSEISFDTVSEALIQGFGKTLETQFIQGELTPSEVETAEKLYGKYRSDEWNLHRKIP
jgi:lipoate-protein ligase A